MNHVFRLIADGVGDIEPNYFALGENVKRLVRQQREAFKQKLMPIMLNDRGIFDLQQRKYFIIKSRTRAAQKNIFVSKLFIILFKRKLSFLFKETFSIRKTLILYKMSEKK